MAHQHAFTLAAVPEILPALNGHPTSDSSQQPADVPAEEMMRRLAGFFGKRLSH